MKILVIFLGFLLVGCAAPKRYVYDHPDAATILLSQTSDISMSRFVLWGLQMAPVDPVGNNKMGQFAFAVPTRIYRNRDVSLQFSIYGSEEYGRSFLSVKMPPGKYKISSINVQQRDGTGIDALATPAMVDVGREKDFFVSKKTLTFPTTVVDLRPGSVNYLGSFRAYFDSCEVLALVCNGYRIEIRDKLLRDAILVNIDLPDIGKIVNQSIKLDRRKSPHFYSVD
ncbi:MULTISPECIES: hypothetical protein [Hydrogenophaga]|uniref:Lipoprotein n=2 Tax=Hydrogenophaga TaxID=47420 RepID=A0ABW2QPY9_9BURK